MGENFSRAFDITFNDVDNEQAYAHTTSWGFSTRFIGAIIMSHGDDAGLILPPRLAPHQVVIVPIARAKDAEAAARVGAEAGRLADALRAAGVRVKVDEREGMSPGWKFNEWERKGVPLRVELGPKDLDAGSAVVADRLSGEKTSLPLAQLAQHVPAALEAFHERLYERARAFRDEHLFEAHDYEELKEKLEHGWVYATHCGDPASEARIQEETKATVRCIPFDGPSAEGSVCVHTGEPSGYPRKVIFAKAY
jgi:prolyl-tRNA synthetase